MTSPTRLTNRSILSISGDDAVNLLQGVLTQDVVGLSSGDARFAALLTPQGKILFDFFLLRTDDGFLIDVFGDAAPALLKRLKMYKLRAKAELAARDDLCVAVHNGAPPTGAIASYGDPRLGELGDRHILARSNAESIQDGDATYAKMLNANGVPAFGEDFQSDAVFLLDVNYDALNAVSYQKGCFVGQEVTSRMKRKGEVRKRTLIIRGEKMLEKGASVMAGDAVLGEITSSSGNIGLARIRLDRRDKAAGPITVDGEHALIEAPSYLQSA